MEHMLARKTQDLLALFYVVVTDRAEPFPSFLTLSSRYLDRQLGPLVLREALGDAAHLFLELKEFLVAHVVDVDFHSILVAHAHEHIPQVFHIHDAVLFV